MTIGLTYDLRSAYLKEGFSEEETAEFDRESTIDGIEEALRHPGIQTVRIGHVRNLINLLQQGERWDLVFNICEGMHGYSREAQVPVLLDIYDIPYTFSDPLVLSLTLHKAFTKRVIRDAGIPTAAFTFIEELRQLSHLELSFPLFVKPNGEGTGKGISHASKVSTPHDLLQICAELLPRYSNGLLVEEYLPGREFTVGILGTGDDAVSAGVMEIVYTLEETNGIYSYQTKSNYETAVKYLIPDPAAAEACKEVALRAWRILGCRDGGRIDLRMDSHGIPCFIEVNPLAGLDKVHSDLPILAAMHGISFQDLILRIIRSACNRAGLTCF